MHKLNLKIQMISPDRNLRICVIISPFKGALGDQLMDSFRSLVPLLSPPIPRLYPGPAGGGT